MDSYDATLCSRSSPLQLSAAMTEIRLTKAHVNQFNWEEPNKALPKTWEYKY
jgi:hypothetical protein